MPIRFVATAVRASVASEVVRLKAEVADDVVVMLNEMDALMGEKGDWVVLMAYRRNASGTSYLELEFTNAAHPKLYINRKVYLEVSSGDKFIDHSYFVLPKELQGKGLADPVMNFSQKVAERFGINRIQVHANIDVGGYAWLRKGFFPDHPPGRAARRLLGVAQNEKGYSAFLAAVKDLTDEEVRAFVLSAEFSQYRNLFLGSNWYGGADLTRSEVREALFKKKLPPAAKQPAQIADATYHSVMLERLKAAEVRDFNAMVPLLEKQVNELLDRLRGTTLSDMTRGQINAQLRLLRLAQQAVLTEATDKLERRLRMLAEYEAGFEASTLQRYLTEAGTSTVLTVPAGPAAFALANSVPLSATGDLLLPWVSKMTTEEVDQINKMILRGYSEGWTNDQLATMLRGTKALNYTDGLLPRMGKHNATIVRTAIQHVASTAREQVWRDNEDVIDRYRWVATLDSRTSPTCRTLDGQEFELGKGPRPPIHPNCRSTTVAIIAGLEHLIDNLQRASAGGQVPANMTYYEWLKTQSASFQEEVLGPSRFKMFARSDMTADKFAKLQLNSAFQPLTLEEIRKRDRR